MVSWVLYPVVILIVLYAGWGLTLMFLQPRLLYRPIRDVAFTPADVNLDYEDVAFESSDGVRLTGWYIPAPRARFTVLFCHGNGGNMMHSLDTLSLFHGFGVNCFIFDYRGYGASEGRPSERGTYRDVKAAYNWLVRHKQIPSERIIVFGRSLGGSIATHLAARTPVAALVVESAFTSYPDIGARLYPYLPVRLFSWFGYNTLARIRRVRCPVMVIHSRDDRMIPFEFGRRLFEAAGEPKRFVEISGSHNDGFLLSGDIYKDAWSAWLDFVAAHKSQEPVRHASRTSDSVTTP